MTDTIKLETIKDFHRLRGLPRPEHPHISIIELSDITQIPAFQEKLVMGFYAISIKRCIFKIRYGQQYYNADDGVMFFMAPNQVFSLEIEKERGISIQHQGWMLMVHPDFLWNSGLARKIKQYDFFDYSVNEALFLSDKEENVLIDIFQNMQTESHANMDHFSQSILLSQIETLLNYSNRFYHRQFISESKKNHQIVAKMEQLLDNYFDEEKMDDTGLPTVKYLSGKLHLSPAYLSGLLKALTGYNTQQHIHLKLIEKAKEKLTTTTLSISEIAYELGFEYPQGFNKFFKSKTNQTPLEFRASF